MAAEPARPIKHQTRIWDFMLGGSSTTPVKLDAVSSDAAPRVKRGAVRRKEVAEVRKAAAEANPDNGKTTSRLFYERNYDKWSSQFPMLTNDVVRMAGLTRKDRVRACNNHIYLPSFLQKKPKSL